jgi:HEAT repeat protein/ATP/ADP translocase
MGAVARVLRIRPGEGRVAFRVLGMMLVSWFGFAVGGNAVEGLLFARFGPNALPYLFVALGVTTAAVMLGMNALLARPRPQRVLLVILPGMAIVVLAMRALLLLHVRALYPVLWLVMMILWTGIGVVTWGIAGAVHDTRQAKRLFPLYGSGLILGTAVGGVATAPLAAALGAENLLFLWAAAEAIGFVLARSSLRAGGAAGLGRRRVARAGPSSRTGPSIRARVAEGARAVRASPLLRWMAVSLALFAVLYFCLSLIFARAATAKFPDADRLAGFLGLFMGVVNVSALLVSLFVANRLYARFGLATMVLALPVIYAAGFGALAISMAFLPVLVFRFVQMLWVNGVWAGAWQAQYNVVPAERRDRTRAFIDGVALQAGVASAGLLLILAQTVLAARALAYIGLVAAILAIAGAWQARRVYASAVVDALRAGNPEVFLVEEEPFGGVRRDAAALAVVEAAGSDPDPAIRRMAMEILAEGADGQAAPALARGLQDEDPVVREAALRGMARVGSAAGGVQADAARLVDDPDPGVRLAAIDALVAAGPAPDQEERLHPLLDDPDPSIRSRAAAALLRSGTNGDALAALESMGRSSDPQHRAAAAAVLAAEGVTAAVETGLADPDPVVRRATISSIPYGSPREVSAALVGALDDPNPDVRADAVEALVRLGEGAYQALLDAVDRPPLEAGVMHVLSRLDAIEPAAVRAYAEREVAEAVRYGALLGSVGGETNGRLGLVAHSLRHRSLEHAVNALQSAGRLWDPGAVQMAIENMGSRDPTQRANALEALDAVGDPTVVRPLLRLWESSTASDGDGQPVLAQLLRDDDPWLRACAAFAAAGTPDLRAELETLARTDPDTLVREAAAAAPGGDGAMETLPSLSLMERVVFLLKVPLFAGLAPADLKAVAEVAAEHLHPDGEMIAEQGEPGDEMYVVVSGEIQVLVGADGATPVEVARRGVGDTVGEMAVVSRAPRMASLVAAGDVRTLAIDRRRFERILRDRPQVSLAVMDVLCRRLRESSGSVPAEAGS